jgi:type 1 fimbriae regulatory protein FimB/type 1 fimbriae regulatory protein FimE
MMSITRVAIMRNPASTAFSSQFVRSAQAAAAKFAVEAVEFPVHDSAEIDASMTKHTREPGGGLIILPDAFLARALQAWLGHKNIQHTVRYTELALDRFKNFWRD